MVQQQDAENISRPTSASSSYSICEDGMAHEGSQDRNKLSQHFNQDLAPPTKISDKRGEHLETLRQELIVEFHETQKAFVGRLQVFLRFFILPLRIQNTKTWISGVPSEVAHFLDWLEDIMVLHKQILSSLESACATQYPIVKRVAESIRTLIPRLEVYQPYLVKFASVMSLVDQLMQDEGSDFGEFVNIQERVPDCDGWKFGRFLAEPVNRLVKLPEFFTVRVQSRFSIPPHTPI